MNILIVGCGDIGARLANTFDRHGHQVSVIDRDAESSALLREDFSGLFTKGIAIDQDILRSAGIQGCDAVIAVTREDNINLMVAQLARDIFGVPNVISRVSDPEREEIFSSFGLGTVSPTTLTVDSIVAALENREEAGQLYIGSSHLAFTRYEVDRTYLGEFIDAIPLPEGHALLGLMNAAGKLRLPLEERLRLGDGDCLILTRVMGGLTR